MKRTTREALAHLDSKPFQNSKEERAHREHGDAVATDRLQRLALAAIRGHAASVAEARDRCTAELRESDKGYQSLIASLRKGDMDATEAGKRWMELRLRRRGVVERAAALIERAADTSARAADPEAYLHSLESRFPSIQHEWPW